MNIGGRAFTNGIMIQSKNVAVKAIRKNDGDIILDVKHLKSNTVEKNNIVKQIPLLRGIYNLFVTNGDKYLTLALVMIVILDIKNHYQTNITLSNNYSWISYAISAISFIIILKYMINIKNYLQYHGVEHMVVNAAEQNVQLDIDNIKKCNRINYRCGTIYVIFLFISFMLIGQVINIMSLRLLLSVGVAFEMFDNKFLYRIGGKYLFIIGGFIQKYFTTLEPDDNQLELGIICVNKLLEFKNKGD